MTDEPVKRRTPLPPPAAPDGRVSRHPAATYTEVLASVALAAVLSVSVAAPVATDARPMRFEARSLDGGGNNRAHPGSQALANHVFQLL